MSENNVKAAMYSFSKVWKHQYLDLIQITYTILLSLLFQSYFSYFILNRLILLVSLELNEFVNSRSFALWEHKWRLGCVASSIMQRCCTTAQFSIPLPGQNGGPSDPNLSSFMLILLSSCPSWHGIWTGLMQVFSAHAYKVINWVKVMFRLGICVYEWDWHCRYHECTFCNHMRLVLFIYELLL